MMEIPVDRQNQSYIAILKKRADTAKTKLKLKLKHTERCYITRIRETEVAT